MQGGGGGASGERKKLKKEKEETHKPRVLATTTDDDEETRKMIGGRRDPGKRASPTIVRPAPRSIAGAPALSRSSPAPSYAAPSLERLRVDARGALEKFVGGDHRRAPDGHGHHPRPHTPQKPPSPVFFVQLAGGGRERVPLAPAGNVALHPPHARHT